MLPLRLFSRLLLLTCALVMARVCRIYIAFLMVHCTFIPGTLPDEIGHRSSYCLSWPLNTLCIPNVTSWRHFTPRSKSRDLASGSFIELIWKLSTKLQSALLRTESYSTASCNGVSPLHTIDTLMKCQYNIIITNYTRQIIFSYNIVTAFPWGWRCPLTGQYRSLY